MYLSRAQSRSLAALAVLLFIGGVFASTTFWSSKERLAASKTTSEQPQQKESVEPVIPNSHELPAGDKSSRFMLQNFQRSEVKDGRKLWEIIAPSGQYNPEQHSASVQNPSLSVYKKDGKRIELTAESAELRFEGMGLAWAKALKAVHINYADQLSLDGNSAIYDKTNNLVTSDEPVTIKTERLLVSGDILKANLETQEIQIKKNVKTTILPIKRKK